MYRMMRNPGLKTDTAASQDDCIAKCKSTTGCSAISWNPSMGICLESLCNNIDLYQSNGWNTYMLYNPTVENSMIPSPQLEWMLTDACGNASQGLRNGPTMNLFATTYAPSISVYAGNSAQFAGSSSSYGVTDSSSACNFPVGGESLTVMFWAYWTSASDGKSAFLEFIPGLNTNGFSRGLIYWYFNYGLFYGANNLIKSGDTFTTSYPFTPLLKTWYHIAYVYDASAGTVETYLNYSLVGYNKASFANKNIWYFISIALSFPYPAESPFAGQLFCIKIFNASLSASQIAVMGESCASGKVRLS